MSRVYQIQVSENVTKTVHVEDGLQTQLELVQILDPGRTGQLLIEEAKARGFVEDESGAATKEVEPGIQVTIERNGTVSVRAAAEEHVELSQTKQGSYDDDFSTQAEAEARLSDVLKAQLAREVELREAEAGRKLAERLDKALTEVKAELDQITNGVTRSALKERAGQLGEVTEVTENAAGEITIKVRV